MEIVVQLIVLLCTLVAFATGFFLFVVQPIWGIIDAAVCTKLSSGAKVAVILLTIFPLGPIMTFFYALFGTHTQVFRRLTIIAAVVFGCSVAAVLTMTAIAAQATPDTTITDAVADAPPAFVE